MTHRITDECVLCGLCRAACPADAVVEGPERYEIVGAACTDCGRCVEVCPQECILGPAALRWLECPET